MTILNRRKTFPCWDLEIKVIEFRKHPLRARDTEKHNTEHCHISPTPTRKEMKYNTNCLKRQNEGLAVCND